MNEIKSQTTLLHKDYSICLDIMLSKLELNNTIWTIGQYYETFLNSLVHMYFTIHFRLFFFNRKFRIVFDTYFGQWKNPILPSGIKPRLITNTLLCTDYELFDMFWNEKYNLLQKHNYKIVCVIYFLLLKGWTKIWDLETYRNNFCYVSIFQS